MVKFDDGDSPVNSTPTKKSLVINSSANSCHSESGSSLRNYEARTSYFAYTALPELAETPSVNMCSRGF